MTGTRAIKLALAGTILAIAACVATAAWYWQASRSPGPTQQGQTPGLGTDIASGKAGKSISTLRGPAGDILRVWDAEKTAAGNVGDYYDNRDRDHSPFNLRLFPQMSPAVYPESRKGDNYGRMTFLLDHVTIGNSSTSLPVHAGGSHPRCCYSEPAGMALLYQQYRNNHLYVYPAHHDHLPGRNGIAAHGGFFGDLYPSNSPYLVIADGSSGSDQPFLQAIAATLAAFRPAVKDKLKESGLLMPTVQMILRTCNKTVKEPGQYLTGTAHPTVFDSKWLDVPRMVQMAHDIELSNIPPMIQMRVVEEDAPLLGKDYFDAGRSESLCDTPSVIGRVFRGVKYMRRMVVSADKSCDVNNKSLSYHWVVLRQQPTQGEVRIKPLNADGSLVEIQVNYQPRYTVGEPSNIETNRVDIGAFAHNGTYYSAPGFVTFFFPDNEGRTYAAGKPVEMGYGTGRAGLTVTDWRGLFASLQPGAGGLPERTWTKYLRPEQAAVLRALGTEYRSATMSSAGEKPEDVARVADAFVNQARGDLAGLSLRQFLDTHVWPRALRDPDYYPSFRADIEKRAREADEPTQPRFETLWRRYTGLALLRRDGQGYALQSVRSGTEPLEQRLTPFELILMQRFHADLLALIYDGIIAATYHEDLVDSRVATPGRFWRDIYRYDSRGHSRGWARCTPEGAMEFNADGLLVLRKDGLGRALQACRVVYDPPGLRMRRTNQVVTYEYDGPQDSIGHIIGATVVPQP